MSTLEITTTHFCKNLCSYCPQKKLIQHYPGREPMSARTLAECLKTVPRTVMIDFAGFVEPFLNPNAATMMFMVFSMGFNIRLFTTLVGLKLEDITTLTMCKFESVVLHLPDNEGDMKANVDDNYVQVFRNFVSRVHVTSAHAYNSLHHKLHNIIPCSIFSKQVLHTRANNVPNMPHREPMTGRIKCGVIEREGGNMLDHNILMPNGDVVLCCMDYGQQHKLGNLMIDSYEDLFKSKTYKHVCMAMKDNIVMPLLCRTCSEAIPG